jgi:Dolichyl-phosphate-mannose-protein mannosyltransferase
MGKMAVPVAGEALSTRLACLAWLNRTLVYGRASGWAAFVLLAGSGWLALRGIDHRFISFSDGVYTYVAATVATHGVRVLYGSVVLSQPPGIVLGAAAIWRASGSVEAIRLGLAALGLLTTLLTYRVARGNGLGPRTAAGAALVALTAPIHSQFSGLDGEAVLAPLALGLALALQRRRPTAAGVLIGAGFFFKLTWLPFAVAGLAAIVLTGGRRDLRRALAAATVAVAGLYGAAIGACGWSAGNLFHEIVLGESGSGLQPGLFAAIVALVVALWWPMVGLARFGLGAVDRPTRLLLVAGVVPLVFTLKQGTFFNVLDPAEPFLAIAAAAGATQLRARAGRRAATVLAVCLVGICLHAASVAGGPLADALPVPVGAAFVRTDNQGLVDRAARVIDANSRPGDPVLVNPLLAVVAGRREVDDQADWFILAALESSCEGAGRSCTLWTRMKEAAHKGEVAAVGVDTNVTSFDPSFARDTGVASMRQAFAVDRPPLATSIYVRPKTR